MVGGIALGAALLSAPMQPRPVDLRWDAPVQCPGAETIASEIEALLTAVGSAEAGPDPDGAPVQAQGTVEAQGEQTWVIELSLQIDGEATQRRIEGRSCRELTSAAAFIIAMAIDPRVATVPIPNSASPGPSEEPTDGPPPVDAKVDAKDNPGTAPDPVDDPAKTPADPDPPSPAFASPPPSEPPAPPSRDPPRRLGGALGLLVGLGIGPTPGLAAVLGIIGGVHGPGWRVDAWGQYWTPSDATSTTNTAIGVRVQAFALGLRGCWAPTLGTRIALPLCAGLGAGGLHGRGIGNLRLSRNATVPWVHGLGGAGLLVRLGSRIALGARVDGHATIASGAFRTEPSGRIAQPRAGGVTATTRFEFRLP